MARYIYDAEGNRVAKGSITAWGSCDTTANGFSVTNSYVLGPAGEQLTDQPVVNGVAQTPRTSVYGAGTLLATNDALGWHFHFEDWQGTRRVQTDYAGNVELLCVNLPYGDGLSCASPAGAPASADDATERHFTGKERDAESGNDYFGARYYASAMGRFLSPDWSAAPEDVPYAALDNPQSLNLYAYANNNPLSRVDPDGHFSNYWWGKWSGMIKKLIKPGMPEKPPPGAPQDQRQGNNAKERATLSVEATANIATAAAKFSAVKKISAASETGVGAATAGYLGFSASGNLAAAGVQLAGAATGQTHLAEEGAEIVSAITSGLGLGELVLSGGDLNKAADAAALEGLVTSDPKELLSGGTAERTVDANEYRENIKQLMPAIKTTISNWLHPISVQ